MAAKKAKKDLPILTRAESEIMALFWANGPMTVAALHEQLSGKAYTSLATFVKILEQKGYLKHSVPREGRGFIFEATIPPEQVKVHHARDLIDRLFGGRAQALVVGLLGEEKLSRDELKTLRDQIDQRLSKGDE